MGLTRFAVSPPDRITDEVLQQAYLAGMERVPWRVRVAREGVHLVLERNVSESANLNIPWDVPGHGRVTPGRIEGAVLRSDSFGNLITNVSRALLGSLPAARWRTTCRGRTIAGLAETYGQSPPGTFVDLIGSTGRLELALVQGSAAAALGACVGDAVRVEGSAAGSTA